MERVYIVPGLAESVLSAVNVFGFDSGVAYFANVSTFMLGSFGALRLAANGIDPGPPDGVDCAAFSVLGPFVLFPTVLLNTLQDFSDEFIGYTFPWDWRKSILTAGDALAARIVNDLVAGEQCSIVAHSAGGVVARRAWYTLKQSGQHAKIRRIVTMGTPHYGSYFVPYAWSQGATFLTTLYDWNQWAQQTVPGITLLPDFVAWTMPQIIDLSMTWPSLYELLPVVGAPNSSTDPNRSLLFQAGNWKGASTPSQAWLTHANTTYRDFILSPDSLPPQEVLVAVAGILHGTPDRLIVPSQLGTTAALGATNEGDSIVTQASAQPPTSTAWDVYSDHASLFPDSVNNGNVAFWLKLDIAPAPTPPPEGTSPSTITVGLPEAPFAPPTSPIVPYGPFGGAFMGGDC